MENSNNSSASSSTGRVGSPSDSGSGSEDIGDAQDEEPSSSHEPAESELDSFIRQWKREIELSPKRDLKNSNQSNDDTEDIEEKAKRLFICGIQAERNGKLQDAISLYRRAIQLVPDIEFRINESLNDNLDDFSDESEDESTLEDDSYDSEDEEMDNLVNKFQRLCSKAGSSRVCQAKVDQQMSHISDLPPEVFLYILKWVVSQDLDIFSLEQVARVCRGFYICARDAEIWRLICLRTWDVNNDITPNRYGSWRSMFIQRPHLSFNGVYISKTTYVRYGESSFQDTNYRPCYLVEYYRYLRFFPDGIVLMLTTPDDPYQSLYKLRHRKSKFQNVMYGRYKLIGSTVMAVVRKQTNDHTASPASNFYRYRRQRQANVQELTDQTFHLELEIKNVKKRINCQLCWSRYSIHVVYRNGQETVSNFDLVPSNFPSFWFSRVKSFTAESESPLN